MVEPIYNADARRRIDRTVLRVESDPQGFRERPPAIGGSQAIWLVRATEDVSEGSVGAFKILWPNGNKGGEVDGEDDNVLCYVRSGDVEENDVRLAIEVCCADDALFEIINTAAAEHNVVEAIATGTFFYGRNATAELELLSDSAPVLATLNRGAVFLHGIYRLFKPSPFEGVYIVLDPVQRVIGRTLEEIPKDSQGEIQIYAADQLGLNDDPLSDETLIVHNRLMPSVAQDTWVEFKVCGDFNYLSRSPWELIGEIGAGGDQSSRKPNKLAIANSDGRTGDIVSFNVLEPAGSKGQEIPNGGTVNAYIRKGIVLSGQEYQLVELVPTASVLYEVVNPELEVFAEATATVVAGAFGAFTTSAGDVIAMVPFGIVTQGQQVFIAWNGAIFVVQDPQLAVTATCAGFATFAAGSGEFVAGGETINATLNRGAVLPGEEYGLIWADGKTWSVTDPELVLTVRAEKNYFLDDNTSAVIITDGFSLNGDQDTLISAWSLRGGIHRLKTYEIHWFKTTDGLNGDWVVSDPDLAIRAISQETVFANSGPTGIRDISFSVALEDNNGAVIDRGVLIVSHNTAGAVITNRDYVLGWLDDRWQVLNPELSLAAAADEFGIAGGGSVDFLVDGHTVQATVNRGIVFDGGSYRLEWDEGQWVVANPHDRFRGVLNANIAADATGSVSIYDWNGSAWADTGQDVTALNDLDISVVSGKAVRCELSGSSEDEWSIYQAHYDCP